MIAIVMSKSGPPEALQSKEVAKPVPKDNTCPTCRASAGEVLIQVHATTAFAVDCELRRLKLPAEFGLPLWIDRSF
jgi:NADPH:quinone reductase-like Zn-dependent oxidoreductase